MATSKRFRTVTPGWSEAKHPRGADGKFGPAGHRHGGIGAGEAKRKARDAAETKRKAPGKVDPKRLPGLGLGGAAKGKATTGAKPKGSKAKAAKVALEVAAQQFQGVFERTKAKEEKVAERLGTRGRTGSFLAGAAKGLHSARPVRGALGVLAPKAKTPTKITPLTPEQLRVGRSRLAARGIKVSGESDVAFNARRAAAKAKAPLGGTGSSTTPGRKIPTAGDRTRARSGAIIGSTNPKSTRSDAQLRSAAAPPARTRKRVPPGSAPRNEAEVAQVSARVERPYKISGLPAGLAVHRHQEGVDTLRKGGKVIGTIELRAGEGFFLKLAGGKRQGPFKTRKAAALAASKS